MWRVKSGIIAEQAVMNMFGVDGRDKGVKMDRLVLAETIFLSLAHIKSHGISTFDLAREITIWERTLL